MGIKVTRGGPSLPEGPMHPDEQPRVFAGGEVRNDGEQRIAAGEQPPGKSIEYLGDGVESAVALAHLAHYLSEAEMLVLRDRVGQGVVAPISQESRSWGFSPLGSSASRVVFREAE